jgi:hypothetical protein
MSFRFHTLTKASSVASRNWMRALTELTCEMVIGYSSGKSSQFGKKQRLSLEMSDHGILPLPCGRKIRYMKPSAYEDRHAQRKFNYNCCPCDASCCASIPRFMLQGHFWELTLGSSPSCLADAEYCSSITVIRPLSVGSNSNFFTLHSKSISNVLFCQLYSAS